MREDKTIEREQRQEQKDRGISPHKVSILMKGDGMETSKDDCLGVGYPSQDKDGNPIIHCFSCDFTVPREE